MSRELTSLLVWTIVFFTFELPAIFWPGCPWLTFSGTVQDAIAWWAPVAIYVAVFAFVLLGHFELHWRARFLIAVAFAGAILFASHAVELARRG